MMKTKSLAIAGAAFALLTATAATAQNAGPGTTTGGGKICLWTYQVDHTHYVNPTTMLFYMKDGKVWQNNLKTPCPSLSLHGFTYVSRSDQICGPEIGINVIQTGESCTLGNFSPSEQHASR